MSDMRKLINLIEGEVIQFRPKQPRPPLGQVSSYRLGDWVSQNGKVGQIVGYEGHGADRDLFMVDFGDGKRACSHVGLSRAKAPIAEGDHTPPKVEHGDHEHYRALRQTGFFGEQAAGCVAMAKTTGKFLVVLRSAEVEEPGTWGNVGGAHKSDEPAKTAAMRELHEETGYDGSMAMVPLMRFQKGTFVYQNFLALVDDEFTPDLGWEATDYRWCSLDDLPSPLHFGIKALLNDPASRKAITHYAELFSS